MSSPLGSLAALLPALLLSAPAPPAAAAPTAGQRAQAYFLYVQAQEARAGGDEAAAIEYLRRALKLDPQAGPLHAELARVLREAGKLPEALAEAVEAVRLAPEDAEGRRTLASLYRDQAQGDENAEEALKRAAEQYDEIARIEPTDGQALLQSYQLRTLLRDAPAAAKALERYVELDPGNAEAFLRLGALYLGLGRAEDATSAFKKALDLAPDSPQGYVSLAEAYAQAHQVDQAVLHYRKALERSPDDVRVRVALGEVLSQARRHQEALAEADAVLKLDPRNLYGLDLRARSLRDLKQFDGAGQAAEQLAGLASGDARLGFLAAFLRVTIAEAQRDFATAAKLLEDTLAALPATGEQARDAANRRLLLLHLGAARQQLGRHAAAAEAFAGARTSGEPDADLDAYYVEALQRAKDPRALAEAKAARQRFPDDPELTLLEAVLREAAGDLKGARPLADALVRKGEKDASALARAAEFHQRGRRYAEAERLLERARRLDARSLRVVFQLGAVLERQNRHDEAEVAFREALKIDPDSAAVLNYLGYMNANRSVRLEEALELVRRALGLDPDNGAYLDSLGWTLFRLGRLDEAEHHLRQAAEKQTDNAVVLDHLGDVLHARGQTAEALDLWRRSLGAEDEDEELDRARVQEKIRAAQAAAARGARP